MDDQPVLILMTKSPIAGYVKTRLTPHVSEKVAAQIAVEMIYDTVEIATTSWPGEVRLLVSPDKGHPAFTEISSHFNVVIGVQSKGDLGSKMNNAIASALKCAPAAAVMGCDIPDITPAILKLAYDRLLEGSTVLGPSSDGGFYFAGFTELRSGLFDQIEWSTPIVLETLLARLRTHDNFERVLLPCLNDIDHWNDFVDFAKSQPRYARFLCQ